MADDHAARLKEIEQNTESALGTLEQNDQWAEALAIYAQAGAEVDALGIPRSDPAYRDSRRVRAYLYLREANALRALGRFAEAALLADRELDAAMASGHMLSIARAMFSLGASCLANGQIERGLKLLDDSRPMFEHHDDLEHRQGLGWWYIIQADIRNGGLVSAPPEDARRLADQALEILRPLENWPGIVRAHAARAIAYEQAGDEAAARIARAAGQMAAEMMRHQSAADTHQHEP